MSLADDLRAAKARIQRPEYWGRGWPDRMSLCEAMRYTAGPTLEAFEVLHAPLKAALPAGRKHWLLTQFNNDPATTHADIMALFDRAIAAAEAAEVS